MGSEGRGEQTMRTDQDNGIHHPEAIVVASGASLRRLGVSGVE